MEKIILGIDPGTNLMGYGLLKVTDGKAQMLTMGVIDLRKFPDAYLKLGHIFERVTSIIDGFLPDEMAIEAPFFGKNVQSMLKLGRAQGTAIAAAIHHGVPIHEYAPMKIKMALTGNGGASKEQVAGMLQRLLKILHSGFFARALINSIVVIFRLSLRYLTLVLVYKILPPTIFYFALWSSHLQIVAIGRCKRIGGIHEFRHVFVGYLQEPLEHACHLFF